MDYAAARRAMVDSQLRPQEVSDPVVIAAMAVVPRERFVPEGARDIAYIDRALPLANGRSLTAPATLGRMLVELKISQGDRVLVVGAATGYAAAVLAEIGARVTALESDAALLKSLQSVAGDIAVIDGSLSDGAPDAAPFDVIVVDGAVETIPQALIDQLTEGGRLGACLVERGVQRLVIGRRAGAGFGLKSIADAAAAPLPGFSRPHAFTF